MNSRTLRRGAVLSSLFQTLQNQASSIIHHFLPLLINKTDAEGREEKNKTGSSRENRKIKEDADLGVEIPR